jgi:sugar phosphate isomerase/epimerase
MNLLQMTTYTRRDFGKLALAALPLPAFPFFGKLAAQSNTQIAGLQFGIETFSFHDLPPAGDPKLIPTIVRNMTELGLVECEIMSGHVEPYASVATGWWVQSRKAPGYQKLREDARRWRLTVPMDYYAKVRKQFEDAGQRMYLYNVNFNETFTDEERDRTFEAAKALGSAGFSSSTVLSEAQRLVPFVEKHKMFVAMHNHNNLFDPDQFATAESFEKALAMSEYFYVTLDIGHFTAGNNDAVAFIRKHHDRIVNIHIRDRKRNNGPNRPFGQGDTPIKEVLQLIRDNHYPIRCYIEYEYGSFRFSVEEVKACLEYCRQALA